MSNFRHEAGYFFRILAAALAALGVILWATVAAVRPSQAQSRPSGESLYFPVREERLNILICGTDGENIDICALIGFLPDKGHIAIAALPPKTLLRGDGGDITLEKAVRENGVRAAADSLGAYLGISVERAATVEYSGFAAMLEAASPVDFDLTLNLDAELRGRRIKQNRGTVALTGRCAADIMLYPAYPRGESQRSDMTAQVLHTLIGYHLTSVLTESGGQLFSLCLDNMTGDLSYLDYESRRTAAQFLAKLEKSPVTMMFLNGDMSGGIYYLTNGTQTRLTEMYSGDAPQPESAQEAASGAQ